MQVKELAELAGTTVRTVRFYHQAGLLPVPVSRAGRRDYDLSHLARLTRIRWLARAGVPLARIRAVLPPWSAGAVVEEPSAALVMADLEASLVELGDQIDRLSGQRDRTVRLLDLVRHGGLLSPLPPVVARFYDEMEHRADQREVRAEIRRERDFMELAYYRGEMPAEAELIYQGLDEADLAESLTMFASLAREGNDHVDPGTEAEQVAAATVHRLRERLGTQFGVFARSVDPEVARHAAGLYSRLAAGPRADVQRAVARALLTALEQERT